MSNRVLVVTGTTSGSGKFLHHGKEIEAPAYAHDRAVQPKLWEVSEQLIQLAATKGVTPTDNLHL
jgi:hypothetical protein